MLNIVIFGAPGSGKGTQSARIVEKYGLNHISTGDVLRAEIKNGTELGKTANEYISNGQLIPDALMIDILASVFDSFKDSKGVIFDGFPPHHCASRSLEEDAGRTRAGSFNHVGFGSARRRTDGPPDQARAGNRTCR